MNSTEKEHMIREVYDIHTAHRQTEGAGFIVRRPYPTPRLDHVDPFLLLDEFGPVDYAPGESKGAPDHPHRGFETVTYLLEGEGYHEDSAGHKGVIGPGDVQWMTAGRGVVHSELPTKKLREEGGRSHGFQVWVNLPARLKMTEPRYQEVPAAKIPAATSEDGRASVKVIAGEALGVTAVIDTYTPIVYQDWTLRPGADVTLPLSEDYLASLYVFGGELLAGNGGTPVSDGQLAILRGDGDAIRMRVAESANEAARVLLLAGVPIDEPVARYGPFVMNTVEEIQQAIVDFQTGRMGQIER